MFKHRRFRTLAVLTISWVALTGVEHVSENAPWRMALFSGLVWALAIAGAWWFAEWTQMGRRTRSELADPAATRRDPNGTTRSTT
ncbi:hypothetical protein ACIQV3_38010 [Streptomyces sp. NPDC099050]|uniref:hypothetical protein n=1 Tax=Streptomyces sp. NPDC099050 TaxID=3366100 RepID=UPI00380B0A89